MCGICGLVVPGTAARMRVDSNGGPAIVGPAPSGWSASRAGAVVTAMIGALMHRGPDESGMHEAPGSVLGATRLAIRGLAGGHQPIVDAGTGVTVVCNGEIDNSAELRAWLQSRGHRVEQPTDVAVLTGAYLERGERFVEDLAGAFAIALWDPRAGELLLARDRAGERPLFYCIQGKAVRFATEIAALATDPELSLTPDRSSIAWYLRFGSFLAPRAPFAEIRKVEPGEVVIFRGGDESPRVEHRRYWRWRIGVSGDGAGDGGDAGGADAEGGGPPGSAATTRRAMWGEAGEDPVDAFDRVFRESVRRQSEAEVDYGVFLSGGIDSSLVAAVARSLRPARPLTAYTLRFDEASYDEGDAASKVASLLGCAQVPVWVRPEDLPSGIATLVRMVGEPLADPAWVPTALLARRAAQDVKLCLVGEGADELFGGYPTYLGALSAVAFARWPRVLRAAARKLVEIWPPSDKKVTLSFLLKRFVAGAEMDGIARHYLWTSNIPPELLVRLGLDPADVPEGPVPEEWMSASRNPDRGRPALLDLIQRIDLESFLAEGLLTKADRAGMQSALELRAPFLDRNVLEFAATLPPAERVRRLTTKVFLKRYARRYLPAAIIARKKRGLSVPLSRWLRGPLHDWAADRLADPSLEGVGIRPARSLDLLREHTARTDDHARAVWTLLVLVEWLRWTGERPCDLDSPGRDL